MKIRIGEHLVDVLDAVCPWRPCYLLGFALEAARSGRVRPRPGEADP